MLRTCRCIKLAIVHDVAEGMFVSCRSTCCCFPSCQDFILFSAAIVGDIAPSDNVTKEVKHQLETEAMHKIRHMLGHDTTAGEHQDSTRQASVQNVFCLLASDNPPAVGAQAGHCACQRTAQPHRDTLAL